jgi:hypothetical protein
MIESIFGSGTTAEIYLKYQNEINDSIQEEGMIRFAKELPYHKIYNRFLNERPNSCNCNQEILIVDDEPYNLYILEALFKSFNQVVVKAENGMKCVELVNERLAH